MAVRSHFPVVPIEDIPASVPVNSSKRHRPVVLVVDDESAIADTLSEILTLSGYAAMPVYDAEEALETALLMPPELLITGCHVAGNERHRAGHPDSAHLSGLPDSAVFRSGRDHRSADLCGARRAQFYAADQARASD